MKGPIFGAGIFVIHQELAEGYSCSVPYMNKIVGFQVLTVVVMKCTIFWDIMPCSV
jgi:hypothetical protein